MRQIKVEAAIPDFLTRNAFKAFKKLLQELNVTVKRVRKYDFVSEEQLLLALNRAVAESWVECRGNTYRLAGLGKRSEEQQKYLMPHPQNRPSLLQRATLLARTEA